MHRDPGKPVPGAAGAGARRSSPCGWDQGGRVLSPPPTPRRSDPRAHPSRSPSLGPVGRRRTRLLGTPSRRTVYRPPARCSETVTLIFDAILRKRLRKEQTFLGLRERRSFPARAFLPSCSLTIWVLASRTPRVCMMQRPGCCLTGRPRDMVPFFFFLTGKRARDRIRNLPGL